MSPSYKCVSKHLSLQQGKSSYSYSTKSNLTSSLLEQLLNTVKMLSPRGADIGVLDK